MLDLLPESVWNSKTRFLDICCKSGNFLVEIYNRLDRILSSDNNFKDPVKRRKHILENQIYGICTDSFEEMMIKRRMLGDPFSDNENISTIAYVHPVSRASKQFKELAQISKQKTLEKRKEQLGYLKDAIKEKFKQMDFDVVVGNPPYNNDMYLDFVMIGHELAKQFTLMITPAKWQAKGGGQNDLFRKTIVPYMSKIVYYPDCIDIFAIGEVGGIQYYIIDKDRHKAIVEVKNRNNSFMRQTGVYTNNLLDTYAYSIVNKLGKIKPFYSTWQYKADDKFNIQICKNVGTTSGHGNQCLFSKSEYKTKMLSDPAIVPNKLGCDNQHKIVKTGDLQLCESVDSYLATKFVRFLVYLGKCGNTLGNPETWRFVPDPGAFDHIFTDEELYKKYNLTDDEIKLVESVIKERK